MPTIKSARKRLKQSRKRRRHNKAIRSQARTRSKEILAMDSREEAEAALPQAYRILDRAAGKNVLHPNKVARKKAQLARHVNKLSG